MFLYKTVICSKVWTFLSLCAEISRTLREVPPGDYLFQIKSFSLLSKVEEKRFESSDFESGGYKWWVEIHILSSHLWEVFLLFKIQDKFSHCVLCLVCRKLCLYPNGYEKENGKGHISLYLAISEADTLPLGWEVNVKFDLFVYDHIRDKYLTIQCNISQNAHAFTRSNYNSV